MARRPDPARPDFIVGDSIGDILAEARIDLGRRRLVPGRSVKAICPRCHGGKTREDSLSVKLDDDGQGLAWHCFRGTCDDFKGNGRIEGADGHQRRDEAPLRRERAPVVKPVLHTAAEQLRPPELYDFFAKRGIGQETVDAFGIYGRMERWPKLDAAGKAVLDAEDKPVWANKATVVFPYSWRGEIVARKFRSPDKQFKQDRDSLRVLFNADAVTSPDEVILVEGEMDVLALWEAGFRQVVSLPDGAPAKLYDEDDPRRQDDKRFDALENCAEILADAKRIIIATDADVPGGYLAEEFARRLGRVRCWRVRWPDGCKDANDVLMRHGAEALQRCVAHAEPWPLAGLWSPRPGSLREFLVSGRTPKGLESGIASLDDIAQLPAGGGWLVVVTGIPSHGKTSVVRPWITYLAQRHDLGIVWSSPEDNRPEVVALEVARIIAGQPLHEAGTYMPEEVLTRAEEWIARRITFLHSDDPDTEMTLDWVLKRAEEAKRRHRRDILLLDPFNEFEHQMAKGESETQYIGRWLRRLKAWGRAEGMTVIIVAHPKGQVRDPKTKKYPVVEGYDINGGANWNNKADLGLTVYRAEEGVVQVHCWKARFKPFGKRGHMARLKLDPRSGRISSIAQDDTTNEAEGTTP